MAKRTADETTGLATAPQAKRPCHHVPERTLHELQSSDIDNTPLPDPKEAYHSGLDMNEEEGLIARFEAIQTALVKHLDQKYRRLQYVAPRSAYIAEAQLAKVTDTMKMLNQEIAAMGLITTEMESTPDLPTNGLTPCRAGNPTYFAPHQYVPVPQM